MGFVVWFLCGPWFSRSNLSVNRYRTASLGPKWCAFDKSKAAADARIDKETWNIMNYDQVSLYNSFQKTRRRPRRVLELSFPKVYVLKLRQKVMFL